MGARVSRMTQEDHKKIIELRQQGKSYPAIAEKVGCCSASVGMFLRNLNVPIRVQGPDVHSDEGQRQIVELYNDGMSLAKIATEFRCRSTVVRSILQKHDVKIRLPGDTGRPIVLTPEDKRRMAELYVGGLTCQKIADLFGCCVACVSTTLRKLGVKARVFGVTIPKEKHPQIIQMYETGQSCETIAKEFGCSHTNIYRILQKHDVKIRPTSTPDEYSDEICQKMVDLYKQPHGLTRFFVLFRLVCDSTVFAVSSGRGAY